MKTKMYIVSGALALVLIAGGYGVSVVKASENNQFKGGDLVQRIVEKFNLDQSEVDKVVADFQQERQQERKQEIEDKINQLVSNGKITEDQKSLILQKHAEMQQKMSELKDLEPEQRRESMQAIHEEMREWAEAQGIDLPVFGMGKGNGMGRGFGK